MSGCPGKSLERKLSEVEDRLRTLHKELTEERLRLEEEDLPGGWPALNRLHVPQCPLAKAARACAVHGHGHTAQEYTARLAGARRLAAMCQPWPWTSQLDLTQLPQYQLNVHEDRAPQPTDFTGPYTIQDDNPRSDPKAQPSLRDYEFGYNDAPASMTFNDFNDLNNFTSKDCLTPRRRDLSPGEHNYTNMREKFDTSLKDHYSSRDCDESLPKSYTPIDYNYRDTSAPEHYSPQRYKQSDYTPTTEPVSPPHDLSLTENYLPSDDSPGYRDIPPTQHYSSPHSKYRDTSPPGGNTSPRQKSFNYHNTSLTEHYKSTHTYRDTSPSRHTQPYKSFNRDISPDHNNLSYSDYSKCGDTSPQNHWDTPKDVSSRRNSRNRFQLDAYGDTSPKEHWQTRKDVSPRHNSQNCFQLDPYGNASLKDHWQTPKDVSPGGNSRNRFQPDVYREISSKKVKQDSSKARGDFTHGNESRLDFLTVNDDMRGSSDELEKKGSARSESPSEQHIDTTDLRGGSPDQRSGSPDQRSGSPDQRSGSPKHTGSSRSTSPTLSDSSDYKPYPAVRKASHAFKSIESYIQNASSKLQNRNQ